MKVLFAAAVAAVMLTVGAAAAIAAPTATFDFNLTTTGGFHPTCTLTITSAKEISNYTVNGVKTEGITTSSVTINVSNGDVIVVKAGTSTASYTVTGCLPADHSHDPHDPH